MRGFLSCTMAVLLIITFCPLTEALAKDVCVQDQWGGTFIFKNFKTLKKPYQSLPLNGIYVYIWATYPFHGTAYMMGDGKVDIGIYVYGNYAGAKNFSAQLRGSTFEMASGSYDSGDEGTIEGPITFMGSINCKDTPYLP